MREEERVELLCRGFEAAVYFDGEVARADARDREAADASSPPA